MELYVFVHVGGGREAIDVRPLEGSESLANSLRTFDAAKAKCFLDTDRQRLWAVIETSFGTFTPFNEIVRGIFAGAARAGGAAVGREELFLEHGARRDDGGVSGPLLLL